MSALTKPELYFQPGMEQKQAVEVPGGVSDPRGREARPPSQTRSYVLLSSAGLQRRECGVPGHPPQ